MSQILTVVVNVTRLLDICVRVDPAHFDLDIGVKDAIGLVTLLLRQLIATDYLKAVKCVKTFTEKM